MSETPYFSVVVPVYNKGPHIQRNLSSILAQTFEQFELVIVCEPSNDESTVEVAKFNDPRIRVLTRDEPGPGGYAARNMGILEANADWIVFIDADDEMSDDHLQTIYESIQENQRYKFYSSGWFLVENGEKYLDEFSMCYQGIGTKEISFEEYLKFEVDGIRPVWTSVVCVDKDIICQAGMFPEGRITMGGDVDTWLRCIYIAGGLIWSNHVGALYHTDSVNMVTKNSFIIPDLHLETTKAISKNVRSPSVVKLLKMRCNNLVIVAWNNNNNKNTEKNFLLNKKLYFESRVFRLGFFIMLSLLPRILYKPIYAISHYIFRRIRKARKNILELF